MSLKIGVVVCAYDAADKVEACLKPWLNLVNELDLELAIVSTRFKEFPPKDNSPTIERLIRTMLGQQRGAIIENPEPLSEHEARNMGLIYLLDKNVDAVWLLDADEFYTEEQIRSVAKMVEQNPLTVWWRIPFKNYVFDGKQWIDGFTPPRVFRTQVGNKVLKEFYWDNDVNYRNIADTETYNYQTLSNSTIPTVKAHVKHLTWLHTNGKDKVAYQLDHFGHCSYKWNEEAQKLEFDEEFHKKHNVPIPVLNPD